MSELLDLLVDVGATYRLTCLVVRDAITAEPRERLVRRMYARAGNELAREQLGETAAGGGWVEQVADDGPRAPKIAKLVTCQWCASVWVAFGVIAARGLFPRQWRQVARALALAAAAGMIVDVDAPPPAE